MAKPINVTEVMQVEEELARALKEWADAGGPVMSVADKINALIDAKLRAAHQSNSTHES